MSMVPSPLPDDLALPFRAEASGVMGRLVRLGPAADEILTRHDYPEAVTRVLGAALALAAMLGAALKTDAKIILQTKTDGPLSLLVVSCESPGRLRGYANFDVVAIAGLEAAGPIDEAKLLGDGHLALTIDPGGEQDRHQGIVQLERQTLSEAALAYFRQSVQLPTFIRLAVGKQFSAAGAKEVRGWRWRVGGLMIQHLSPEGGAGLTDRDILKGDGAGREDDDDWERTRILATTVEDHELIDPTLAPERLLIRLFNEEGVRAYGATPLVAQCNCSHERLAGIISRFKPDEIADMVELDGLVKAKCEFCSTHYRFRPEELAQANRAS
jgi:molecular chaperone Hsp33